ncbi:PASTA domain-containing protein [Thermodesulfatator atlanticus]
MKKYVLFPILGIILLGLAGLGSTLFSSPEPFYFENEKPLHLGPIYDVEKRLLAESVKKTGILLVPEAFPVSKKNLMLLASLLKKDESEITYLLSSQKGPVFFPEVKKVPELQGVYPKSYFERSYPFKEYCSSFLAGEGYYGLEAYYQRLLFQEGAALRTSIKIERQKVLYQDLLRSMKMLRAKEGAAAVVDISSGRILAYVTKGKKDLLLRPNINLAVLSKVFEKAYQESHYENLSDFLRALGFGEITGVDLAGEEPGILPTEIEDFSEVQASGMQILRAMVALATGTLVSPKIALEVSLNGEKKPILVERKKLKDLTPLSRGGVWWWGGSFREKAFLMAGLWPRKHPKVAFMTYLEGVKAYGLPCYYTRFIPQAVKKETYKTLAQPKKTKAPTGRMPDVRGLTLKEALERLAPLGLKVEFSGFGVTVKQWPAPGTPLARIENCKLVLR